MQKEPLLVYYSGSAQTTKDFIDKMPYRSIRLPISRKETMIHLVDQPFIMVTPTYGAGREKFAVPQQVLRFFNEHKKDHRTLCLGVIGGGNRLYGDSYVLGAKQLAQKLRVPLLGTFEVSGLPHEVDDLKNIIETFWKERNP